MVIWGFLHYILKIAFWSKRWQGDFHYSCVESSVPSIAILTCVGTGRMTYLCYIQCKIGAAAAQLWGNFPLAPVTAVPMDLLRFVVLLVVALKSKTLREVQSSQGLGSGITTGSQPCLLLPTCSYSSCAHQTALKWNLCGHVAGMPNTKGTWNAGSSTLQRDWALLLRVSHDQRATCGGKPLPLKFLKAQDKNVIQNKYSGTL